jgi:hypothetical protein
MTQQLVVLLHAVLLAGLLKGSRGPAAAASPAGSLRRRLLLLLLLLLGTSWMMMMKLAMKWRSRGRGIWERKHSQMKVGLFVLAGMLLLCSCHLKERA